MRRFLLVLLVLTLLGGAAAARDDDVLRDEAVGLAVPRPAEGWVLNDLSQQGVVVHVYSPPGTMVPRMTLMSFPQVFLPDGMGSRAAQIERMPGVRRIRFEAAPLTGETGVVYETVAAGVRTIELGIRRGDRFLILQVAAREADWADETKGAAYRRVFSEARFIDLAEPTVELRVDGKTPAEVRALREHLRARKLAPFRIAEHDVRVDLWPEEERLVVTDDLLVEAREEIRELPLGVTAVEVTRIAGPDGDLAFFRRGPGTIVVTLDPPLKAGESRRLRYEARGAPYRFAEDQELVREVAVQGQVGPDSSFSSHVRYYPTDARNDAPVRISISVPAGYTAVAGGEPLGVEEAGDRRLFRFAHAERVPRLLPIGFAAGRYERVSGRTPGGLGIDVYHRPGSAKAARQRLDVAVASGAVLERLMGPLPSSRVSICEVAPFRKETGVSLPGLILLSGAFFRDAKGARLRGSNLDDPDAIGLLVVADELSHQWNGYATPLPNELAEGVSTFTNLLWLEETGGREEYEDGIAYVADAYLAVAEVEEDVALADPKLYRSKVYRVVAFCRTAAVLDLLRRTLGDEVFFPAWREAFVGLRGKDVDYQDFERALSEAAGRDLRPFFDQWVFRAGHPRLTVRWRPGEEGGVRLEVEQTQPGGLFDLLVPFEIGTAEGRRTVELPVRDRRQAHEIETAGPVESVRVDPARTIALLRARVLPAAAGEPSGRGDRIPFLEERLTSGRWQVRYMLIPELTGRDAKTKRLLETLARDEHEAVARAAQGAYVGRFLAVDREVFDPRRYAPGRFPLDDLPEAEPEKALVDHCLGRRKIPSAPFGNCLVPALPVLDPANRDDPEVHVSLTIVGILGEAKDAPAIRPFADSANDHVALGAARALLRLGDREKGIATLLRLAGREPREHLFYVTQALSVLRETGYEEYEEVVRAAIARVEAVAGEIQPNWLAAFLLLAAEVEPDVFR